VAFHSIEKVMVTVADAIDGYNNESPHMSINWKSHAEVAFCMDELKIKGVLIEIILRGIYLSNHRPRKR
jgi:hypothetical protein